MYYKEGLNSRFVCRNHNWGRKLSKFSGEISEGFILVNKLFRGVGGGGRDFYFRHVKTL